MTSQFNQSSRQVKGDFIHNMAQRVSKIPDFDKKMEEFRRECESRFEKIKDFELMTSNRHNETIEIITEDFEKRNK